jgi:ATP-binding cassette subfamily F protein 3
MLNLQNISLQLGNKILFKDASLLIFANYKVGLIGENGCGKSTLFSIIRQEIAPDKGEYNAPGHLAIAYLSQETPAETMSALEYVVKGDKELVALQHDIANAELNDDHERLAVLHTRLYDIDGYTASARAAQLLDGLGFSSAEHAKAVYTFSGGWRMRLNLAQTLMMRSELLLLDEPTNHLDLDAIFWLEKYLKQYEGTLLLISHDREFLDATMNYIAHVENQQIKLYSGNYSSFERTRAERLATQQAMYEKQQKQISHMKKYVDRFRYKASKAKQAQSRLKAIERMEIISAAQADSTFNFEFREPAKCSNPILTLKKANIAYEQRSILADVNLSLTPGARIGLLGPNGAGKSTLIKLLAGEIALQSGEFVMGQGIKVGYYAQHQLEQLVVSQSPLQHLQKIAPRANEQQLRSFLGSFAFTGEMALAAIQHFSGGEKARLALALLVWQAPNLLLLDEPTNHLDLDMRSALSLALQSYEGAMIIVSHDRHLLRTTTDEFLLVYNQQVNTFDGDIEDYQRWLSAQVIEKNAAAKAISNNKAPHNQKSKLETQIKSYEKKLDQLQAELVPIENWLSASEAYQAEHKQSLQNNLDKQKLLKKSLVEIEHNWLVACQELEKINSNSR